MKKIRIIVTEWSLLSFSVDQNLVNSNELKKKK